MKKRRMKPEVKCTCPWTDLFIHWDKVTTCCYQLFNPDVVTMTPTWGVWDDFSLAIDTQKVKDLQNSVRDHTASCINLARCNGKRCDKDVDTSGNVLQLKSVTVSVTAKCNAHCAYCSFVHEKGPDPMEPSLAQVRNLMNNLKVRSPQKVWYTGGDPLVLPNDKLDLYMDLPCPIMVTTNGMGLNKSRWERYFVNTNNVIRVTLDTINQEIYEKLRGPYCGEPTHIKLQKIMNGSDLSRVEVGCTVNTDNIDGISDVLRFANDMRIPTVWLNGVCPGNSIMETRLLCFHGKYRSMAQLLALKDKMKEWETLASGFGIKLANNPPKRMLEAAIKQRAELDNK